MSEADPLSNTIQPAHSATATDYAPTHLTRLQVPHEDSNVQRSGILFHEQQGRGSYA